MLDIPFNSANIFSYVSIPTVKYGVLTDIIPSISASHSSGKSYLNSFPNPTGVTLTWNYPISDNLRAKISVSYQVQIYKGSLTTITNETPLKEFIFNGRTIYADLSTVHTGSYLIPVDTMFPGESYTARIRMLVFSEKGVGTFQGEYFKYTNWGYTEFSINSKPFATSLTTNGSTVAAIAPGDSPKFSFIFSDADGPSYSYRVQVGTNLNSFSANIWDSGLIAAGSAFGLTGFSLNYAGPALYASTYYWRVYVDDGLTDGTWSPLSSFVAIGSPHISQLFVNGSDVLFGQAISGSSAEIEWTYDDSYSQTAYVLVVKNITTGETVFDSGEVFTSNTVVNLTSLPVALSFNDYLRITLRVKNIASYSQEYFGDIVVIGKPSIENFKIENQVNPLALTSTTPVFSWSFLTNILSSSAVPSTFRIQVSTDYAFSSLVWDTGRISGLPPEFDNLNFQYGSGLQPDGISYTPIVSPHALTHGQYFVRLYCDDYLVGLRAADPAIGFFAINHRPNSPTILTPTVGAYSGSILISWIASTDTDGDSLTYSLQFTRSRSANTGWKFLAGPFSSSDTSFLLDSTVIPAGNDFGVRIIANDGFIDSDPSTNGTSPVTTQGLGFTIMSHPPKAPIIVSPRTGDVIESILFIEWAEWSPPSIDGLYVNYLLEMFGENAKRISLGIFPNGTFSTSVDTNSFSDGDYTLKITATDSRGNSLTSNATGIFTINNTPSITDLQVSNSIVYASSSDGKVYVEKDTFLGFVDFNKISGDKAIVSTDGSKITISCPAGTSCLFRSS